MLKQYETVFIMTPVLSEDQVKETVKSLKIISFEKGLRLFTKRIGDYEN